MRTRDSVGRGEGGGGPLLSQVLLLLSSVLLLLSWFGDVLVGLGTRLGFCTVFKVVETQLAPGLAHSWARAQHSSVVLVGRHARYTTVLPKILITYSH